jgi:hypothetical protein
MSLGRHVIHVSRNDAILIVRHFCPRRGQMIFETYLLLSLTGATFLLIAHLIEEKFSE